MSITYKQGLHSHRMINLSKNNKEEIVKLLKNLNYTDIQIWEN